MRRRGQDCSCLAALVALLTASVATAKRENPTWGPSADAQRPSAVFPKDLGPVTLMPPSPDTKQLAVNLDIMYDDYHRIKTRPLLHLEPAGSAERSPQLLLYAAFLDTRPLYYPGQPAVLRMLALKYEPQDSGTPDVYCQYMVEGDDRLYTSKAHGPLRVRTNDVVSSPYRDVTYTCNTSISSMADIEALAGRWHSYDFIPGSTAQGAAAKSIIPRWATLVATPDQQAHEVAWLHVTGMPLVHDRAADVNKVFQQGAGSDALPAYASLPPGPYMTPAQYHAGEGHMAVCAGPVYGGDHHAGVIAEWAEFQRMMGVNKVFLYDFDMGTLTSDVAHMYQAEGLFEVFEFVLSKRLLNLGAENDPSFCGSGKTFHRDDKRQGHMSREWVAGCTGQYNHYRVYLHAESALRTHCIYNAAARYRWVAVADLDEWLVPRVQPATNWQGLFKLAMEDAKTGYKAFGYQYKDAQQSQGHVNVHDRSRSPFPSSFMFLNAYVCAECTAKHHLAANNVSLDPKMVVAVPPKADLPQSLRIPQPSLAPITWSVIRAEVQGPFDRSKCISDPLAVMSHYAHHPWSYWDMEGGSLKIPTTPFFMFAQEVGFVYHVRVSDHSLGHRVFGTRGRAELFQLPTCYKDNCGGPYGRQYDHLFEDWTLTNLYGEELVKRLQGKFRRSHLDAAQQQQQDAGRRW